MKNKVKIAIAAGGLLASVMATAPAQAYAATAARPAASAKVAVSAKAAAPMLVGSCPEAWACAWNDAGYLFWSTNADNYKFPIDENILYVENLTGYKMDINLLLAGGYTWWTVPPHTGLTCTLRDPQTGACIGTDVLEIDMR